DALHAVGTLLHDAARAHGHVGVVQQFQARRGEVGVLEEVEPPHLVGAVVGAVAGADAAVVDHVVEAVVAVGGRRDRADQLARGVLAMHARHRLEVARDGFGLEGVAGVVVVDAQPVHLAAAGDLALADDGDVVLGLAGDDAGAAADAGGQVDGHAPLWPVGVRLAGGVLGRVQRHALAFGVLPAGEVRVFAEPGEGVGAEDAAFFDRVVALEVDQVVVLDAGQLVTPAGPLHLDAGARPRRGPGAQPVHIEAGAGADLAGAGAAVAEVQRHGVVGVPRHGEDRHLQLLAAVAQLDLVGPHVAVLAAAEADLLANDLLLLPE